MRDPVQHAHLMHLANQLLITIGENPDRPGLADTPRRWAQWWQDFISYDPGVTDTTFEAVSHDQMVVVTGMRVWSICEHHLLPFWCDVSIGYIARQKVLGLSKFARIAHKCAHRLQLQERLCADIAAEVCEVTQAEDVAVYAQGQHLCMTMRGIQTPALMKTSVLYGAFNDNALTRNEFMHLATAGELRL